MHLALKGISKVSLNRKDFENVTDHLGKVVSLHLQSKGIQALVNNQRMIRLIAKMK